MKIQEAISHPLVQYARENLWETGVISIPEQFEKDFYTLPEKDRQLVRAFFYAATSGCPEPVTLAEDPKHGPAYQERRYGSTSTWYHVQEGIFRDKDGHFGDRVDLTPFGERGHQDAGWVPENRQHSVQGPSTYEGFTLPRMIIDVLNFSVEKGLDPMAEVTHTLDLIENVRSPLIAIASLAFRMHRLGMKPDAIKARIYDSDYGNELPKKYWFLLFSIVSAMLPEALQYHG